MGIKKAASIATRSLAPGKPHHAQWLVNRKCNFRCIGCSVWKEQDERELSTDDIKKGLDILKKLGIVELVLSGGDPLLRDDIGEIINYASKLFVTTICDNGSIASKKIDALRNVDFVAISIDSLDEAKNDYIKAVPGAWKKAMETVEILHNEGINVSVTPTISQKNLYEIIDITNYFTKKGIPVWYCLYSYDVSVDEKQLFRIGKENEEFVIKDKQAMIKLCDSLIEMKKKNSKILMTNKLLKTVRSLYEEDKRTWKCQALSNFLVVDHLGRVAGCHSDNYAGSIFDLPEIWKSQEFKKLRETNSECTKCNYLCYVFYSVQGSPRGHLSVAFEQWKNAKLLFKKD
ncbi:MAG: radical SAM protein [Candidatus Bathyarchaeia archaeon]|jgi:MoaA/NifB/PqqE/SkfB family radical SAM enzyme